jgi:putative peptidoglycan lipid II flippase
MLIKILTPSFFARQEPKIPMYVALISMVLNAILAWLLGFNLGYGHIGLALASSISAFFTAITLLFLLKREKIYESTEGWIIFWIRLSVASIILILFLGYFSEEVSDLRRLTNFERTVYILKMVILGMGLYLLALRLTGLKIKDFIN